MYKKKYTIPHIEAVEAETPWLCTSVQYGAPGSIYDYSEGPSF